MKRKVAVIMAADVVGYSRLMSENEEATVRRLMLHRAVFEEHIQRGYGRIFNTAGDAVLAEFPSSVDALRTAVDVQEIVASENESYPVNEKMLFRIGITVGDVLEKDGDLLGDAVNIAARLEGIADAGGICVSQAIFEQVAKKVDIKFKNLGGKSVKNIPEKIQVFSVVRSADVFRPVRHVPIGKSSRLWIFWRHKWKTAFFACLLLVIILSGRDHGPNGTSTVVANSGVSSTASASDRKVVVPNRQPGDDRSPASAVSANPGSSGRQIEPKGTQTAEDAAKAVADVAPPAPPPTDPDDEQSAPSGKHKEVPSPGLGDIAYDWLKSKADAGDAKSMNTIGVMYLTGLGRDRDEGQAVKWFKLAVDRSDSDAMLNLGRLYLNTNSNFANSFEGMRLIRLAVEAKNAEATELLSEFYYTGNHVGRDLRKAAELTKTASELGTAKAMGNLCFLYMKGISYQQDYSQALKWCRLGADAGDAGALGQLGALYVQGWGVPQDTGKAIELLLAAASKDSTDAMRNLGVIYEHGEPGTAVDYQKSFSWYKKAAEAGDPEAMTNLAVMYLNGNGTTKDVDVGKQWLERAIAAGDPHALYDLGAVYENDKDTKSQRHAFDLYKKSAENGDAEGMMMTGIFLCEGRSMPKNVKLGVEWLKKAKQAGVVEADAMLQSYQKN